jgi:hypothetical protein
MVGDELLDGRSRDTNSDWIIDRGTSERWRVQSVEVLPDDTEVISEAIGRHFCSAVAWGRPPTTSRGTVSLALSASNSFLTTRSLRTSSPCFDRGDAGCPRATGGRRIGRPHRG